MQCTDCSNEVKPVVAIDIDGTLGDYHSHFIRFAQGYLNRNLPIVFDGSQEFSEALGLEKSQYREMKLAYRQGGLKRTMPAYPGATGLMYAARDAGAEVWVTTTRPYLRLDNVDPDTRWWLEINDMKYDGLLYDVDKYQKLAEIVDPARVVAVVEDVSELWDAAHRLELSPIQHWTPWNEGARRTPGFDNLSDIMKEVVGRVTEWRFANA